MEDFDLLSTRGNIAFYNSCEITELFLVKKTKVDDRSKNEIINFFTICVLEENSLIVKKESFLTPQLLSIDKEYSLGIKQYRVSIDEVKDIYFHLVNNKKWYSNHSDAINISSILKSLPKQYIPSQEGNRLNACLKNNFHSGGSYILEIFDEEKKMLRSLLDQSFLTKYNELCGKIREIIPIDLSILRDRIGNYIFQFPITVLDIEAKALKDWNGVQLNFAWHSQFMDKDILIQVESTYDNNYMGAMIEDYNNSDKQSIDIGNLDQINHIKIWRKKPSLIIAHFSGTFIKSFDFSLGIINHEPRIFEIEGIQKIINISSRDKKKKDTPINYTDQINSNLYEKEKNELEKKLSFKQYHKVDNNIALEDIRKLIKQSDKNGVYLWDPFLRSNDILKTLYFSETSGVELRAIGAINSTTNLVYNDKSTPRVKGEGLKSFFTCLKSIFLKKEKKQDRGNVNAKSIINKERQILENSNNNNLGLNLEFRMQYENYGWKFHDRFLIFPGDELNKPRVYALGTSINSFGKEHNILQIVAHPQPVIDSFNDLWNSLDKDECIVWKHKK